MINNNNNEHYSHEIKFIFDIYIGINIFFLNIKYIYIC